MASENRYYNAGVESGHEYASDKGKAGNETVARRVYNMVYRGDGQLPITAWEQFKEGFNKGCELGLLESE